jgi:hypothetical protein
MIFYKLFPVSFSRVYDLTTGALRSVLTHPSIYGATAPSGPWPPS